MPPALTEGKEQQKQTPQKAPLPCFGLEHNRFDPQCQTCPHFDSCLEHMGSRANKISLEKIKFDIVPEKFRAQMFEMDDPELPYLQRLYSDCFSSVFHTNPLDNVTQFKTEIAANARRASCSIRMFMLANMVAHEVHQKEIICHTDKQRPSRFRGNLLAGNLSVKRAKTYQDLCRDRYGAFTLKSLEILTNEDKDDLEATMLRSEVTVGNWLVAYKIHSRAPRLETMLLLYDFNELQLSPQWLAMDQEYVDLVLRPYVDKKTGTEVIQRHRFDAFQTHCRYKKRPSIARNAWLTRQSMLPQAMRVVVNNFGYGLSDFLYPRESVTDMIAFWLDLGTVIRHNHCWRFLNDQPSYFTPRRNATLVRSS